MKNLELKIKKCNNGIFDSEMQNLLQCFVVGLANKEDTIESMRVAYNEEISRINLIMRHIPLVQVPTWHDYKDQVNTKYNSFRYTVENF